MCILLVNHKPFRKIEAAKSIFSCHNQIVKVFRNTSLTLKYHSINVALVFSRSLGIEKTRSPFFSFLYHLRLPVLFCYPDAAEAEKPETG